MAKPSIFTSSKDSMFDSKINIKVTGTSVVYVFSLSSVLFIFLGVKCLVVF